MPETTAPAKPTTAVLVQATYAVVRAALVVKLHTALQEQERARLAYVAPFASHDTTVAFFEACGRSSGLGMAIDALDALAAS